ncbi:thiamine phosphate synthase [Plesiomonas shigelloides]|uniref:thiamine phosphate synthase n=1 Tax=Plesiomonas shigelloides TaxID=703 RepID=UPI002888B0C9|nr:thiamine phosphate synthase [Plesiomonas shigelloides]MDT1012752.1 thiamine phosphate synthase [Plesiomonas shigelloides]
MPASSATHSFPAHHFAPCQSAPLGFYPVVDSLALLERLLALGVRTLQLRIKAPFSADVDAQIAAAVALGRRYEAQLFINDHWQAALQHGAYGVHLGQEDLALADLSALAAAGLRLGVSTHGYAELLQALALQPSYIALGHIFPTPTKQMPSRPQGLGRLRQLQALVGSIPTVAIGGIDLPCAPQVLACGVGSIAVVRAVTQAEDLAATVQRWQSLWQGNTPLPATVEEAVKC